MKREILNKLTIEEIKEFIKRLEYLLEKRYNGICHINCPLCNHAMTISDRIYRSTEVMYCEYCVWNIFNNRKYKRTEGRDFCDSLMIKRFPVLNNLSPVFRTEREVKDLNFSKETKEAFLAVIEYRKRSIPQWIYQIKKYIKERDE